MSDTVEDYRVHEIADDITRIELAPVQGVSAGLARSTNVYLIDGASPALINAGHPGQSTALSRALRDCGVSPAGIERIVATSWLVDVVGGAVQFPQADLFVLSPDMEAPRDYEMHLESRRRQITDVAQQIAGVRDDFRQQPVEDAVERYFPRMTRDLRFAPLRNGQFVQAGPLNLEVLATEGPAPGHMGLYDKNRQLLWCGDFSLSGLPNRLRDTQAYLVGLERLAELPSKLALPNEGRVFRQGRWTVSRAANFLNNFLSNAPAVLVRAPTVLDFIERDRGGAVDDPVELVAEYQRFRHLFDELVRTRTVAAEGQGMERRYGIDVDDPREKLRRHTPPVDG